MNKQLHLRIVLEKTPIGVCFGLQKGKSPHSETLQMQVGNNHDLSFDCVVDVKGDPSVKPNFLGAYAQGPPTERFIYIGIGTSVGQIDSIWSRRLKIPLMGITWEMIQKAEANGLNTLETRVSAIGKDGTPSCGTVKPFAGWVVGLGM